MTGRRALAVDGGNTKTIAVVAGGGPGRARRRAARAARDIYGAPSPAARWRRSRRAVAAALAEAGVPAAGRRGGGLQPRGADWPEDFALLERELPERLGLRETPLVVNDALGALRGGLARLGRRRGRRAAPTTRSARAAPTGASSTSASGPTARAAATSPATALRAVYRADLDLGPPTVLVERALALYGAADGIALLHEFTRRGGLRRPTQDRLAPVVLDAADEGDAVARRSSPQGPRAGRAGARLRGARGLPLAGTRVVLTGRVLEHPTPRLADAAMAELPGAVAVRHGAPPVAGALLLAFDRIGARDGDAAALAAALPTRTEGAPDGWDRPRARDEGLPRRRASPSTTSSSRSATASSWSSSGRRAAASRRCCG